MFTALEGFEEVARRIDEGASYRQLTKEYPGFMLQHGRRIQEHIEYKQQMPGI